MSAQSEKTVEIVNDLGLHLRAAGALAQVAGNYQADIWVCKGTTEANAKSIMSVLSLTATKGAQITIRAAGHDAADAVDAIATLITKGFATE